MDEKPLFWRDVPAEHRTKVASWLSDQVHDLEVDRESMADEQGFDFVKALSALERHVRKAIPNG